MTEPVPGHWFKASDATAPTWRGPAALFDLDGGLAGFGCKLWQDEKAVYTASNVLAIFRSPMTTGMNQDMARLAGP